MRWSAEEKSYRLANYKRSWRRRRRTHLDELEFDGEEEDKLIWMWMENREKSEQSILQRNQLVTPPAELTTLIGHQALSHNILQSRNVQDN
ncbi:hypothetical protein L3Y34_016679 [Caenorhabditis briggsae]|uniref:Uncharacterized protein n=1 Tax=Caenorhabditis briggsae TaxID=6238 RepID=A0AAE9DWX7_CAEBR|nr:hypothetical protein L3Y34_016679 [Caenorhabditis briggsae]